MLLEVSACPSRQCLAALWFAPIVPWGEIVDEEALADALQRDRLRGAALDVYVGEFEHTPISRLWSDPRVLITPHISSASDQDRHGAINLFCDNLRAYLEGGPLRNVIDWERGY
jgi:phosphoglycerate dehydrogenase-like enzyme